MKKMKKRKDCWDCEFYTACQIRGEETKDLCQVCKNFSKCEYGEEGELNPMVKQEEVFDGCWEVVCCNRFQDMNKK